MSDPAQLVLVVGLLAVMSLMWLLLWFLTGRQFENCDEGDWTIDVSELIDVGPPPDGPQLECYNVPVRLCGLVLASAGRGTELPTKEELPAVIDEMLPGFLQVLQAHQPKLFRWSAQLSSRGFTQAFFANTRLPGDRGRGTPWCAIAGRFEVRGQGILVGIICRSTKQNSLSQIVVQREGQWLDIMRVRGVVM